MKMTVSNVDRGFGSLQQKNNDFCLAHMHLATLYEYKSICCNSTQNKSRQNNVATDTIQSLEDPTDLLP